MNRFIKTAIIIFFSASIVMAAEKKSDEKYLADLKSSSDEKILVEAADWAAENKKKEAIESLIKLLDNESPVVRLHAVIALGQIGEEKSVKDLNSVLLNDESADVRYAALLATVRIGSKDSIKTWQEAREKETDPYIKDFLIKLEAKAAGKSQK